MWEQEEGNEGLREGIVVGGGAGPEGSPVEL